MSWLNPYSYFKDLMCKLTPEGKICEDHMRAQHPECFREQSKFYYVLELPQMAWRRLFPGNQCAAMANTHHSLFQDQDSSVLGFVCKIVIFLAVTIGILYAILKVYAQRRASAQ